MYMNRCDKECFANKDGECQALTEPIKGECPFQKTDITMEQQIADMAIYNSNKNLKNDRN